MKFLPPEFIVTLYGQKKREGGREEGKDISKQYVQHDSNYGRKKYSASRVVREE